MPRSARHSPAQRLNPAQLIGFTELYADEVRDGKYPFVAFDAQQRWHQRIYRDQRVDLWLISWLPEQGTQLHDHGGSSGAFTVITGTLTESTVAGGSLRERRHQAGASIGFGRQYVHDVQNRDAAPAISVHAYSPPLTSMTYYDLDDGQLTRLASVATDDPEADVQLADVRLAAS